MRCHVDMGFSSPEKEHFKSSKDASSRRVLAQSYYRKVSLSFTHLRVLMKIEQQYSNIERELLVVFYVLLNDSTIILMAIQYKLRLITNC